MKGLILFKCMDACDLSKATSGVSMFLRSACDDHALVIVYIIAQVQIPVVKAVLLPLMNLSLGIQ